MSDELLGGLTNEEARQAVLTYFNASYTLSHDVIYPRHKPPQLENRTDPFILLSITDVSREQEGMGSTGSIVRKFLDIELWVREYSGEKVVSLFTDFVDSLGFRNVGGIAYKTPQYNTAPIKFKGWEVIPAALPFEF